MSRAANCGRTSRGKTSDGGGSVDTHTILWYLTGDPRLSKPAMESLDAATSGGDPIFVPAICWVELVYLTEKGRLPFSARQLLTDALEDPEKPVRLVAMDRSVVEAVPEVSRDEVPDMPDRIIAATAVSLGLPLISRDSRIRASRVDTIW